MGKGRVTIPTDLDVVPQTLEMIEEWGADAIRDCDGTEFPQKLKDTGAKIYATYYTTRKDNAWAKAHPEEIQQLYSSPLNCSILCNVTGIAILHNDFMNFDIIISSYFPFLLSRSVTQFLSYILLHRALPPDI